MLKRLLLALLILVLLLVAVILFNTFRMPSQQVTTAYQAPLPLADSSISHLQRAIRYRTVSFDDSTKRDTSQFSQFQRYLRQTYPLVHQRLQLQRINRYTLLYRWAGKDNAANPVVLLAHQDVVPVEASTAAQWQADPFSGTIKNGYIWGRGTVDDKISVIAILEATERLLQDGFVPPQPILLVFGHDEEAGGRGAATVAKLLQQQGVKPAFVLDEGGIITKEKIPGLKNKPVALIGTAEKGYVTVKLAVNITGGHSSMPARETAIDVLARAVTKLRENQFEPQFSQAVLDFMQHLGPEMPFVQRLAFANRWLFAPLIKKTYTASPAGNAILRTTTAPTIITAGVKENVVPSAASAIINFRTLPGITSTQVLDHIKQVVNDPRIKTGISGIPNEATPVSSADHAAYRKIAATAKSLVPGLITAPYLMVGASDARSFTKLTPQVYRLYLLVDPIGFHGIDERASLPDYRNMINFYYRLLRA